MRAVGIPHSQKPPTANDDPLLMSCTACADESTTLSIYTPITLANIGLLILVASFEGKLPLLKGRGQCSDRSRRTWSAQQAGHPQTGTTECL